MNDQVINTIQNTPEQPIQPKITPTSKPPIKPIYFLTIFLIISFISAFIIGGFVLGNNSTMQKACTMEAKICPDGSSVGRSGPNCEFATCPNVKLKPTSSITPTCKPRPECLDEIPKCMIAETSDMCPAPSPTSTNQLSIEKGCKIGGCSGEICQDSSSKPLASICIYKEEYSCYKKARCETQANGQCGWTMDEELKSCLEGSK